MSKSLIFDTETTGLFPRYNDAFAYPIDPLEDAPHLMDLCFVLVDDTTGEIEETYNEYVQIPDDAIVSEGALKVHKITKQKTVATFFIRKFCWGGKTISAKSFAEFLPRRNKNS